MGAAPAYSRDFQRAAYAPRPAERSYRDFDVNVVPGQRQGAQPGTLSSSVVFLAKTVAIVLVVIAVLGIARIALTSATVSTSLENRELSSQIDSARKEGNQLEVAQSSLSNPSRVKTEAGALGMGPSIITQTIVLDQDVVALDAVGNLSLTESVRLAAGA